MRLFNKAIRPTVEKTISTTLVLYDVNVTIELVRKNFEATFYYTDKPHDRYSDTAVKEKVIITATNAVELLDKVKEVLL